MGEFPKDEDENGDENPYLTMRNGLDQITELSVLCVG